MNIYLEINPSFVKSWKNLEFCRVCVGLEVLLSIFWDFDPIRSDYFSFDRIGDLFDLSTPIQQLFKKNIPIRSDPLILRFGRNTPRGN